MPQTDFTTAELALHYGGWGARSPTSKVQEVKRLHCLLQYVCPQRQRSQVMLFRGSSLSYNDEVIGLTVHCLLILLETSNNVTLQLFEIFDNIYLSECFCLTTILAYPSKDR